MKRPDMSKVQHHLILEYTQLVKSFCEQNIWTKSDKNVEHLTNLAPDVILVNQRSEIAELCM